MKQLCMTQNSRRLSLSGINESHKVDKFSSDFGVSTLYVTTENNGMLTTESN